MGRPRKEERPEDTMVLLLRAAEDQFGANGFRNTRLGDIAAAVGIRRSSLLYHFGSKEKLHAEVVKRAFAELRDVIMRSAIVSGEPEEQLSSVVGGLLDFGRERPGLACVVLRQLVDPRGTGRDQIATEFGGVIDGLEQVVSGISRGRLPEGYPIRSAILQLMTSYLVRVACGETGERLWRGEQEIQLLARTLLLGSAEN